MNRKGCKQEGGVLVFNFVEFFMVHAIALIQQLLVTILIIYVTCTVSVHPQYAKSILISLITTGLSPGKLWVGLQLLIVINRP